MAVQAVRNVRPRAGVVEDDSEIDSDMPSQDDEASQSGSGSEDEGDAGTGDSELDEEAVEATLSNVSFGALKQAQESISKKRKRGSDTNADQEDKLEALRARLRQIKEQRASEPAPTKKSKRSEPAKTKRQPDTAQLDDDSDSDSGPSEEGGPMKSRSSKHAPGAQSSKYQVTRKRVVVDVPKRVIRDPRFDALQQHSAHTGDSEKAYSFLRDYQKSEMDELRAAIRKTKNEDDKQVLRRKLNSMENKLKAKESKESQQEVLRKHRREERAKVEQGKTPFYLKQKDIKEQALVEKFKGMKSKDREKLIEKRRKKEGQKEKKRMPEARRVVG
ncbi:pre-rRNA processing protein [Zymoseptoria brevis]|uniref:rRNA biogenesis protein RRP36 n=1 Tax=Zymoseptoria brevis TaxID=1047168 RepID=A0A0F4GEQ4_9PEZI|nr:pre-rRNA processing protein [Zymoseptoria brevis]